MLTELFVLVLVIIFVLIVIFVFKKIVALAINSLIGFFALLATQIFLIPELAINFWSVIITAIGGIIGYILVLILHLIGIAF